MSFRLRSALAATMLCLLLPSAPASAQSAADKATARQLAIEGVEAFRKKDYAGALGKLTRAQKLYDAPVHLVYIARASAKLGKLVEAAEAYRKLVRTRLAASASDAFRDAVESGKKELHQLEPRIPKLKVEVEPADVEGLDVRVGQSQVPAAALGANRPTNPGELVVTATAPGYEDAQQSLKLAEGETKAIKIVLEESENGGGGAAVAAGTGKGGEGESGGSKSADPEGLGFVFGLRVSGVTPSGTAFSTNNGPLGDSEVAMSDLYGPGGGAEIRGGIRFLRYFTGHLVAGIYQVKSGPEFRKVATPLDGMDAESQARLTQFGIGVAAGTAPGKLGAFGELDLMLVHNFTTTRALDGYEGPVDNPTNRVNCDEEWVANGGGLRLAGGVNIPLSKSFQLTPMLGVTFAGFGDFTVSGCEDQRSPIDKDTYITNGGDAKDYPLVDGLVIDGQERESPTHTVGFLGIGVDWLFGADIPSK